MSFRTFAFSAETASTFAMKREQTGTLSPSNHHQAFVDDPEHFKNTPLLAIVVSMPRRFTMQELLGEQPIGDAEVGKDWLGVLPEEILLYIWQFVEEPARLARTNKRFYALSRSTLWRAKWFMQAYALWEVIFQAIRRPKLFTAALVEQLVRLKAPLSRNLVQLLFALRDPILRQAFVIQHSAKLPHARHQPEPPVWGTTISDSSYVAVLQQAANLYGEDISFEPTEFDSYIFSQWLASNDEDERLLDRVLCLFRDFDFIPLVFEMKSGETGPVVDYPAYNVAYFRSQQVVSAITRCPRLARVIAANGIRLTYFQVEEIIDHMDCPTKRLGALISGSAFVEELKVEGIVPVSSRYASNSIHSLCGTAAGFEYIGSQLVQRVEDPREEQSYNTLMYLRQESALPFSLSDAVSNALKPLLSGAVSAPMIPMAERLERDFPDRSRVSSFFVRCMFLKAERQSIESLDEIKAMMGHHRVRKVDVDWACLRNGCRTTVPLRYALRWLEGFDLARYTEGLVEQLLLQPYRGIMLRELERFHAELGMSTSFHKLLTAAVESQAFTSTQLPPQHWDGLCEDDALNCNYSAPVRSLLAFNFAGSNAKAVNLCKCKAGRKFYPTSPTVEAGLHPPRQLMTCKQREKFTTTYGTRSPWIMHVTRFGGGSRREELPDDDDACEDLSVFCNLYGPLAEDDEPIAEVLVDLLGPQSYAADVLLSHAIVNGNASLVDSLLSVGVALTLEHFKVALKVGYYLPTTMLDYVTSGGPFKLAFGAADVCPDGDSARLQILTLTDAQLALCRELAKLQRVAIVLDVREDGTVLLQELSSTRTRPVSVVEASRRPSRSSRITSTCTAWEDRFYNISNAKLWRPHLIALNYIEEQKHTILKTATGRPKVQSNASMSLSECITSLRDRTSRHYGRHEPHEVAFRATAPLWAELDQEVGDAALLNDVKRHVYLGTRGVRTSRHSRRKEFQRSPYSYKSSKFKGTFVTDNPLTVHEPQLEPLSDEDDEDEDFTRAESDPKSIDSDSDAESLSSVLTEAPPFDWNAPRAAAVAARLRADETTDADAEASDASETSQSAPSPAPSGDSVPNPATRYPGNSKPSNFSRCCHTPGDTESASSSDESDDESVADVDLQQAIANDNAAFNLA